MLDCSLKSRTIPCYLYLCNWGRHIILILTHLLNIVFPGLILQWWTAEGLFNGEKRSGYWFYFFFSINRSFETGKKFLNYSLTNKFWKWPIQPNFRILLSISIFKSLIKTWDTSCMLVYGCLSCICRIHSILCSYKLCFAKSLELKCFSSIL